MVTINLKDFYPWHTQDEYIEVSEEVEAELLADQRYEKTHQQRIRRNKAYYSLDVGDGIEHETCFSASSFHEAVEHGETMCQLCRALNSLPETQGRRIEAHYILGKSYKAIADIESVDESSVRITINRGLQRMKKYLENLG